MRNPHRTLADEVKVTLGERGRAVDLGAYRHVEPDPGADQDALERLSVLVDTASTNTERASSIAAERARRSSRSAEILDLVSRAR